jgi:hypothetical protein
VASRRSRGPSNPWAAFAGQAGFFFDCQAVVALRLLRIAGGGTIASSEANRMVSEKVSTFVDAHMDAISAFQHSGIEGASAAVARRYQKAVSGNRRRLSALS